ncbi:MAG: 2-oxoglutarate oxidoreductase [Spirochaetales bacterium]|nr:2-oxoglutarate oxidoreductase [Spirochaetales bacterium]
MKRPDSMFEMKNHYCPGCGHGIIHNMLGECIDELGVQENTILVAPVGCAVMAFLYFKMDGCEAPHGRVPAVATGIKRVHPDKIVLAYQGDGDLLAIGMAETIHAANRGENITVIFVNNANYGMTGGQMAPTTLPGQRTKTTPKGRNTSTEGFPIKACELINTLEAPVFIERCSVHNVPNIRKTKRALKKALENQIEKRGYSFVEVLSMCPTNWGMQPVDGTKWLEESMIPAFPLGNFRDRGAE